MTLAPLVLAGAGGFARETVELVAAINDLRPTWDLVGFLDDDERLHGTTISGTPVVGPMEWARDHDVSIAVCTGSPSNYTSRARIVGRLGLPVERFATLTHPTAVLPRSVQIGAGCVIHALTVATGHSRIGEHVAMMPAVVVTHDDVIDDFVTIGAGVRLAGGVHVGIGAYLGSGCMIREDRRVGEWSLVGMGSVVTRDVPCMQIWAGNPATYRRPSDQSTAGLCITSSLGTSPTHGART
jgi:sugar O-acyltransferase (sialic acid O-acetyltransferase NeuD family)